MTDITVDPVATTLNTIQAGLAAAQPGDRVLVRPGVYRERLAPTAKTTPDRPITVMAADPSNPPTVKGSVVVTGWIQHRGYIWRKDGWATASQQVFQNGSILDYQGTIPGWANPVGPDGVQIYWPVGGGLDQMTPGSCWYDQVAKTLYCWLADNSDPNKSTMEVSTAQTILDMSGAQGLVWKGIRFCHSSTSAFQQGGGAIVVGPNTLDSCDVRWCDFAGVTLGYKLSGAQVLGCSLMFNGCNGISGASHSGYVVKGCTVAHNNYRSYNVNWGAAGVKLATQSWGTIEGCTVYGNRGTGLWFDYCDGGQLTTIQGCVVHNNLQNGAGVMIEGSKNFMVRNNTLRKNSRRGIYCSASDSVQLNNNVVLQTLQMAAIDVSGMPRTGKTLTNISLVGNILIDNQGDRDLMIVKENGTDIQNLTCEGLICSRSGGTPLLWWGLDGRGNWAGTNYTSLSSWIAATPFDHTDGQQDILPT